MCMYVCVCVYIYIYMEVSENRGPEYGTLSKVARNFRNA